MPQPIVNALGPEMLNIIILFCDYRFTVCTFRMLISNKLLPNIRSLVITRFYSVRRSWARC